MTTRLTAISAKEVPDPDGPSPHRATAGIQNNDAAQAATKMLLMALGALGQRFVVALSNIYGLVTVASAFYLWAIALPTIDTLQIVACSIYSVFVLAINVYGRRK